MSVQTAPVNDSMTVNSLATTDSSQQSVRNRPAKTSVHILCDSRAKGRPDLVQPTTTTQPTAPKTDNTKNKSVISETKILCKSKELSNLGRNFIINLAGVIQSRIMSKGLKVSAMTAICILETAVEMDSSGTGKTVEVGSASLSKKIWLHHVDYISLAKFKGD